MYKDSVQLIQLRKRKIIIFEIGMIKRDIYGLFLSPRTLSSSSLILLVIGTNKNVIILRQILKTTDRTFGDRNKVNVEIRLKIP